MMYVTFSLEPLASPSGAEDSSADSDDSSVGSAGASESELDTDSAADSVDVSELEDAVSPAPALEHAVITNAAIAVTEKSVTLIFLLNTRASSLK
jgi:hypothetical protein